MKRKNQRAFLYRHFNENEVLLYVGISISPLIRLKAHRNAEWVGDIRKITLEEMASIDEARIAESWAVRNEYPVYNHPRGIIKLFCKFVPKIPIKKLEEYPVTRGQVIECFQSKAKIAKELGVSRQLIHAWKHDKPISVEQYVKLRSRCPEFFAKL